MSQNNPVDPEKVELFRRIEDLPEDLWLDLASLNVNDVCRRAGVSHNANQGFTVPFLGTDHIVNIEKRTIITPDESRIPGFQTGMILLKYLHHASDEGLSGRMVTDRELNGGELFFKGPHALSKSPVLDRFARNGKEMIQAAAKWGATEAGQGDASFKLLALPKVLICYTLYEQDDEFSAELTITFDAYTDIHLPLDCIWALINIVSYRLSRDK